MTPFDKAKQEAAEKFTRDVNGVSQVILSPRVCYEAGADWGYAFAKQEVEDAKLQVEFLKQYFNGADTSFKEMVEAFHNMSDDDKQKLIELTQALAKFKEKDGEG